MTIVPKFLQVTYLKILLSRFLYWACFLKIENRYVNKLLTLGAIPSFKNYCELKRTAFHSACASGNYIALDLLRAKVNRDKEKVIESLNKELTRKLTDYKPIDIDEIYNNIKNERLFLGLNGQFRDYVYNSLKYIYKVKKSSKTVAELMLLQDDMGNNPIHLTLQNGHYEFIREIHSINFLPEKLDTYLSEFNKVNISGYGYLKERGLKNVSNKLFN